MEQQLKQVLKKANTIVSLQLMVMVNTMLNVLPKLLKKLENSDLVITRRQKSIIHGGILFHGRIILF